MDLTYTILYLYGIIPLILLCLIPVLWNKYGEKIQEIYWSIIPYDYRPSQIFYYFKCLLFKRYNIVKCRYLDCRWHDRDTILAHTMFEILSQFIEKECSTDNIEWYGEYGSKIIVNGKEKYVRDEMQDIYDWWHKKYNKEYPETEDIWWEKRLQYSPEMKYVQSEVHKNCSTVEFIYKTSDHKYHYQQILQIMNDLDQHIHKELQDYMHRIVNIMDYMWT